METQEQTDSVRIVGTWTAEELATLVVILFQVGLCAIMLLEYFVFSFIQTTVIGFVWVGLIWSIIAVLMRVGK